MLFCIAKLQLISCVQEMENCVGIREPTLPFGARGCSPVVFCLSHEGGEVVMESTVHLCERVLLNGSFLRIGSELFNNYFMLQPTTLSNFIIRVDPQAIHRKIYFFPDLVSCRDSCRCHLLSDSKEPICSTSLLDTHSRTSKHFPRDFVKWTRGVYGQNRF